MVHIQNIPHILEYGITHTLSPKRNPDYTPIGDSSLITNRKNFTLSNGQKLGDFIPFYFGFRMPMLYVIQHGFNGVSSTLPENIIYCITSVEQIIRHDLKFVFTNGHAVDGLSTLYNHTYAKDIDELIDIKAINAKYWNDEKDLDLKRRKEAEFLVENDIPAAAILGYAVYNKASKDRLARLGIEEKTIIVKEVYYF